jgi:hypothetical protein
MVQTEGNNKLKAIQESDGSKLEKREAPSIVVDGTKWFRSPKGNYYRPKDDKVKGSIAITAFFSRRDNAWKLVVDGQFGEKTFGSEQEACAHGEKVYHAIMAKKAVQS